LRVGTLVAANDFRHPLVLAKEAATIDVISAGRFELGLGAGWDGSDYATERKIGWVREAAGDRAAQVELGALVFAVEITTHKQQAAEAMAAEWDLTPQDVIDSPHLLAGTPGQIAEDLLGYRERYGISYWVVQDMQPFAQVLPRLAGS